MLTHSHMVDHGKRVGGYGKCVDIPGPASDPYPTASAASTAQTRPPAGESGGSMILAVHKATRDHSGAGRVLADSCRRQAWRKRKRERRREERQAKSREYQTWLEVSMVRST